jgi:hypothetical protein
MRRAGQLLREAREPLNALQDYEHEHLCKIQSALVGTRNEVCRIRLVELRETAEECCPEAVLALHGEVIHGIEITIAEFLKPSPMEERLAEMDDANEALKIALRKTRGVWDCQRDIVGLYDSCD